AALRPKGLRCARGSSRGLSKNSHQGVTFGSEAGVAIGCELTLEEAERQAEIQHQEFVAAEERRRKEDVRRRIEQSVSESHDHLGQLIQQWANVLNVERFLAGVERRIAELSETERGPVRERLALAREFLGTQDPLAFFLLWKTPRERYCPPYPDA
ncbi:MAG: hypothetical protein KGL97_00760, partial [Alphaproteobacteria bacterium]|nr:hypothetical protein [Alphaproteobacteria bacterium]